MDTESADNSATVPVLTTSLNNTPDALAQEERADEVVEEGESVVPPPFVIDEAGGPFTIEQDVAESPDEHTSGPAASADAITNDSVDGFEAALAHPDAPVHYESDDEIYEPTIDSIPITQEHVEHEPPTSAVPVLAKAEKTETEEGEVNQEEMEEGEVGESSSSSDSDTEAPAIRSAPGKNEDEDEDEEEGEVESGPLRTKNEILDAPVKPIEVEITAADRIEKLGVIERVVGKSVIVRAYATGEYQVLDQDSILVFEDRTPFGRVFETLGPVQKPLYSVKFNTDAEASEYLSQIHREVFYVPNMSGIVLTAEIKAIKGSDASNWNDEEVDDSEIEFSDDEAEIEYKRRKKESRRRPQNELAPQNEEPRYEERAERQETSSFADLAGQDTAFLDKLAQQFNVQPPPAPTEEKSEPKQEQKPDTRAPPRSYDDEPYKPLVRPSTFKPGQRAPTRSASPSQELLTPSQKRRQRRQRRKRPDERDRPDHNQRRPNDRNPANNRNNRERDNYNAARYEVPRTPLPIYQPSPLQQPQRFPPSLQKYARQSGQLAQQQQQNSYQQPNLQDIAQRLPPGAHVNPAFFSQLAAGVSSQQVQQQQTPPAPSVPQFAQSIQQQQSYLALLQQQLQQQLQQPSVPQYQPPPPLPVSQYQPPPVQPQLSQAQPYQTPYHQGPPVQQYEAPYQARPVVAPQPAPQQSYQNATQAQLQQQLQSILLQMQNNAQRSAAPPQQSAPMPVAQPPQDAFAQAQYQLNLLGMLGGNADPRTQGPGGTQPDPRKPR